MRRHIYLPKIKAALRLRIYLRAHGCNVNYRAPLEDSTDFEYLDTLPF